MTPQERSTVVGLFHEPDRARDAIESLKDSGFDSADISILMHDRDRARDMASDTGADAATGAATGAIGGGILGGLAGWLVGIGALAIPGVGPFIAAGAFGAALAGAGIGAGVGAIAGALVGMGVPKEEADWYEGEVRGGNALVTVKAGGRYEEARSILRRHGAYDIQDRTTGTTMGTTAGYTGTGGFTGSERWDEVSPRFRDRWQQRWGTTPSGEWTDYEEDYRYGWEMHSRPEYRGRSWIELEPEFRRDYGSRYPNRPWDRASESIRDAWDYARGERGTTEYAGTASGGMRDTGTMGTGGTTSYTGTERWEDVSPGFRSRWQSRFGTGNYIWEDYEPSYRYGWEMHNRPEYQGRSWSEVEPEFRRDWERRYSDKPWDRFAEFVKDAWEDITDRDRRRAA